MLLLRQAYRIKKEAHPDSLVALRVANGFNLYYQDAWLMHNLLGIRLSRQKPPVLHLSDQHIPLVWKWGYNIVTLNQE